MREYTETTDTPCIVNGGLDDGGGDGWWRLVRCEPSFERSFVRLSDCSVRDGFEAMGDCEARMGDSKAMVLVRSFVRRLDTQASFAIGYPNIVCTHEHRLFAREMVAKQETDCEQRRISR